MRAGPKKKIKAFSKQKHQRLMFHQNCKCYLEKYKSKSNAFTETYRFVFQSTSNDSNPYSLLFPACFIIFHRYLYYLAIFGILLSADIPLPVIQQKLSGFYRNLGEFLSFFRNSFPVKVDFLRKILSSNKNFITETSSCRRWEVLDTEVMN